MTSCTSHSVKSGRQKTGFELADILRRYLPGYLKTHNISLWQRKILYDIQICRTAACGAHLEVCDHCSYQQPAYDSCHNRHCPKCQGISRRRWVSARLEELLPVPYYHVVFTLPHRLNDIALYNKHLLYNLFYSAAAYTLLKFGKDPKHLGAQLGFMAVLHTWGKGLCYHIHWHFIVPGGGLTEDEQWVNLPYSDKYLFPVTAMSEVIRARFIKLFRKAYEQGELIRPDSREDLSNPVMFEYFLNDLASDNWVNYAKRPFGSPEQVVKYIGRYTHRVALANNRLLDIDGGKIRFLVKDYKNNGRPEEMTLSADEFIRRFLLHVLPKRFRKIRYAGFLASAVREANLELARHSLPVEDILVEQTHDWQDDDVEKCPQCHIGKMRKPAIVGPVLEDDSTVYFDTS